MKSVLRMLFIGVLVCLACAARGQDEPPAPIVRDVEIRFSGPETVNRAVVLANIQTAVGKPYSASVVEQDVRDLISTGYFLDVQVSRESVESGVKVIYQVRGKATVKEITFDGLNRYKEPRIRRELSIKAGDLFDERKAHLDAQKIVDLYQKGGFADAKVDPIVNIDRDTGKAILQYRVTEGPRVFLKNIEFQGDYTYRAKFLRHLMKTRYRWWGSWLSSTGVVKQDELQEDLATLRDYYRDHGYLDMEVRGRRLDRVAPQWVVLRIDIFEGPKYKVGNIVIEGNKLFPTTELERQLKMTTDQTFTPAGLNSDVKALEDYYGARGYLDTRARVTRTPNIATERIDLLFTMAEGELTSIDKIRIRGNVKTKDKVIRRELAVAPGELYNTVRVDKSAERLKNLGFFSKVDTSPQPTSVPDRKDLVIEVEEQRTGTMTFGAGFSSVDSLLGFVEMTQGNFDLFNWPSFTGAGQKLRARVQIGFKRQDYLLSFTEPWFLDQRLSLGFDLFHNSSSYLSTKYTEARTGGDVRLEKALTEFIRAQLQYSVQEINDNVDKNASAEMRSQDGNRLRSAVEATLTYDTRDSVFLTTRGNRTDLSVEVAGGPFGGDISLYKLNARSSFYFPLFNKQVIQVMGATGVVDTFGQSRGQQSVIELPSLEVVKVDDVPLFDRYFLGGPNNLRGFSYRKVSPRDIQNEPVGGNTFANATVEYTYPIVERIRGAVFFDAGNVWRDAYEFSLSDLKADVGVGVRLNLPIGPFRLDYGYPVLTDKHAGHTGKIQFSVGYQF